MGSGGVIFSSDTLRSFFGVVSKVYRILWDTSNTGK